MILGTRCLVCGSGSDYCWRTSRRYGRKRCCYPQWLCKPHERWCIAEAATYAALYRLMAGPGWGLLCRYVTLVAEYVPSRRKDTVMTAMYSGFSLGSGWCRITCGGVGLQHFLGQLAAN